MECLSISVAAIDPAPYTIIILDKLPAPVWLLLVLIMHHQQQLILTLILLLPQLIMQLLTITISRIYICIIFIYNFVVVFIVIAVAEIRGLCVLNTIFAFIH